MKRALVWVLVCGSACGGGAGLSPDAEGASDASAAHADVAVQDGDVEDAGPDVTDSGTGPTDPVGFRPTASLATARNGHTATRLLDGRVLIVGGENVVTRDPMASVEIYDPDNESWAAASDLPEPRSNHEAVRLEDGRVLVMGGGRSTPIGAASGIDVLDSAVLYDPSTNQWESTGSLGDGRSHFGAVRLASGHVLVAGGGSGNHEHGSTCTGAPDCGPLGDTLVTAEVYDPATGLFRPTGSMREARSLFTLTHLEMSDTVAAVAGMNDYRLGFSTSEVYDEVSGTWSAGPSLASEPRVFHAAAPLPSGRLLVGGGKLPDTRMLATADVLDFEGGSGSPTAPLAVPHTLPRFVPLPSGRVLSTGGFRCPNPCGAIAEAELYDEDTGRWSPLPPLGTARAGHTATLLDDGRVLIVGGFDAFGNTPTCELSISE